MQGSKQAPGAVGVGADGRGSVTTDEVTPGGEVKRGSVMVGPASVNALALAAPEMAARRGPPSRICLKSCSFMGSIFLGSVTRLPSARVCNQHVGSEDTNSKWGPCNLG